MIRNLLVFDSHPVQYRVPIWQGMELLYPGCIHVAYASDCSVRGYEDKEFGQRLAWDEPLLDGYSFSILNCENGVPLSGWKSLTGAGVKEEIKRLSPSAILLTGLNYRFDFVVYLEAKRRRIPIWLRSESQDHAFNRSKLKSLLRSCFYKIAYAGIKKFFYIGELNRLHYLSHGVQPCKLAEAHYCTVDRFKTLDATLKTQLRIHARKNAEIESSRLVVGFSGKFIPKKNPWILYKMLWHLPRKLLERLTLYFIGSGELEEELKELGEDAYKKFGVDSFFAGFIKQIKLPEHYLAMDILVLPSQKMGETWGLVANEALQAGCGVVVSSAVGCSADFKNLDRFAVFEENNEIELAECVLKLSEFERDFNWATEKLNNYSIESVAVALSNALQ